MFVIYSVDFCFQNIHIKNENNNQLLIIVLIRLWRYSSLDLQYNRTISALSIFFNIYKTSTKYLLKYLLQYLQNIKDHYFRSFCCAGHPPREPDTVRVSGFHEIRPIADHTVCQVIIFFGKGPPGTVKCMEHIP